MKILKGKPLADEILEAVKARVEVFANAPVLRVFCDDENQPYYKGICKDAEYCGIKIVGNAERNYGTCDGAISLVKDITVRDNLNMDGGKTTPCTAEAVMRLLAYYDIPVHGRDVCIIGRSERVGKPLAQLMTDADATVTLCHSKTPEGNLMNHMNRSDIVVSCVGGAEFDSYWIPNDRVVIDIGGDFFNIDDCCAQYAPAKGGVGPVTRAVLMKHIVERYVQNHHAQVI